MLGVSIKYDIKTDKCLLVLGKVLNHKRNKKPIDRIIKVLTIKKIKSRSTASARLSRKYHRQISRTGNSSNRRAWKDRHTNAN